MTTMRAAVVYEAGGPEMLKLQNRTIPVPELGQVLIRVRAFGLNRSELFTRQGHSPNVPFPRVLGIEATGLVVQAPGGEFEPETIVATAMGGMGRQFDGAYAEYVCVPASQVQTVRTTLPWETLGACPEMLQTAWGSLYTALRLEPGQSLLIRGGTTSVGLAAAAMAAHRGVEVIATSRRVEREQMLVDNGAHRVLIDIGSISEPLHRHYPNGVDKVLELVGTTSLLDSLQCAAPGGSVCMTGMVGNRWSLEDFSPMAAIPTAVNLTTYSGGADDFMRTPLQTLLQQIERSELPVKVGRVFTLAEIVEAHRCMESNAAGGKIVVLV